MSHDPSAARARAKGGTRRGRASRGGPACRRGYPPTRCVSVGSGAKPPRKFYGFGDVFERIRFAESESLMLFFACGMSNITENRMPYGIRNGILKIIISFFEKNGKSSFL